MGGLEKKDVLPYEAITRRIPPAGVAVFLK